MRRGRIVRVALLLALFTAFQNFAVPSRAQKMDSFALDEARTMLRDAHEAVKKYYYDPSFHGLDLDARYRDYDEKIRERARIE